jgi:hypothetical protein
VAHSLYGGATHLFLILFLFPFSLYFAAATAKLNIQSGAVGITTQSKREKKER